MLYFGSYINPLHVRDFLSYLLSHIASANKWPKCPFPMLYLRKSWRSSTPYNSHSRLCKPKYVISLDCGLGESIKIIQLDALAGKQFNTLAEPTPTPSHARSTSLSSDVFKAPVSPTSPNVATPARVVGASEKEREKLLYPGRVSLASQCFIFICGYCHPHSTVYFTY